MRLALSALLLATMAGCTVTSVEPPPDPAPAPTPFPSPAPAPKPPPQTLVEPPAPPATGRHDEVVHVYMRAHDLSTWYCTGTLVSPTVVVTAAHCLEPSKFRSYEIVAPGASGAPRVAASDPRIFGGTHEDVANPDMGILTLSRPVPLAVYAELTDVVASVEAGEAVSGGAVVRTEQKYTAGFAPTEPMPVSSTAAFGYEHGFGVPMFSKGGDSGAGLFLVENGKLTHKLIAVGRNPEPERNIDHFSRVDDEFLVWFRAQVGAAR